jgi:hypothetical protein
MLRESDIMVPEDHADREPLPQQGREQVEDHACDGGRGTDDRVLHIADDNDPTRIGRGRESAELLGHLPGAALGEPRPFGAAVPESDVQIRDRELDRA